MFNTMYLIGGFPGTGKTELSSYLSALNGATLLDKDTMARPLVEKLTELLNGDPHDVESQQYVKNIRPLEYDAVMSTAWSNLNTGKDVICAAPFLKEMLNKEWMAALRSKCVINNVLLKTIWVTAECNVLYSRLSERNAARDNWKLKNWDIYEERVKRAVSPEADWIVDNSNASINQLAIEIDRLIKESYQYDIAKLQAIHMSGNINPAAHLLINHNPTQDDTLDSSMEDPYGDMFFDEVEETDTDFDIYMPDGSLHVKPIPQIPFIRGSH